MADILADPALTAAVEAISTTLSTISATLSTISTAQTSIAASEATIAIAQTSIAASEATIAIAQTSIAASEASLAADLNALKVRGVDSTLGIETASAFNALDRAMLVVALRNAKILTAVNEELLHPTTIPLV